jgi:acetyl esterase/lipase
MGFIWQPDAAAKVPAPTEANAVYGEYDRSKLDFWKAASDKPTPVLVFYHGGGFRGGDKKQVHRFFKIDEYLKKGVSVITVNYPFLAHTRNDYSAILRESKKSIEFIHKKAEAWNIDSKRIGAAGCSAGSLISQYIGASTDDISVIASFMQPMGTQLFVLPWLTKEFPPVVIYQTSPTSDKIHHPRYAKMVKDACDRHMVHCELWGSGKNGIDPLPKGKDHRKEMQAFFLKQWGMK